MRGIDEVTLLHYSYKQQDCRVSLFLFHVAADPFTFLSSSFFFGGGGQCAIGENTTLDDTSVPRNKTAASLVKS